MDDTGMEREGRMLEVVYRKRVGKWAVRIQPFHTNKRIWRYINEIQDSLY
jgi:hypothetical protein